jgi:hypothetical protein
MTKSLTRPIAGIENRTAQEVFDIMCDRIRLSGLPAGADTPPPSSQVAGWTPPQDCDGKEQLAFEAWAIGERYDMHEHPLHYLFMDKKTNAARQGWKAALKYVREQHALATTEGPTDANS